MSQSINKPEAVCCLHEYARLKSVVLCAPEYMRIREVINETQKFFAEENIDIQKAVQQHQNLVKTLEDHNIHVIHLPPNSRYPEQVFTRDIGFTIGSNLFVAQMKRTVRQGEEKILIQQLQELQIPFTPFTEHTIEGGDVIIDGTKVWIGDSDRTSVKAINNLQKFLVDFEIIGLPFEPKYLHLDCVFNVISPTQALIFPPAFDSADLEIISQHYDWIEVTPSEQFTLGTNVLSLGNQTVLSLPINKKVNEQLRHQGFQVIEIDISEIIKSGGSFRCVTLPLTRV